MIGAVSGEPEARRRRLIAAIAAPPASNAAGQSQTATRRGPLPARVPVADAFEPRARPGAARLGPDAEVGRRGSSVLAGRTCFEREGDVITEPRTGLATGSVAEARRRIGDTRAAAAEARRARLTESAPWWPPRDASRPSAVRARVTAIPGAAGALGAGGDAVAAGTAVAGAAGARGGPVDGAGVTGGAGVGAAGAATGAGRNSSGSM
jgi:hypothetical protein